MTVARPVIGIIGAGRLGMVLARLATRAGYQVLIAASGDPKRIALADDVLAEGATATTALDAAERADVVILALPFRRYRAIPADALAGKLVIDATNYWWEADGLLEEFRDPLTSSSELLQGHLRGSRVVKAFNHMSYADLGDEARPPGQPGRKAIGIAGNDADDVNTVAALVDDLGFDPVAAGTLADGVRLEPGTDPFGADVDARELQDMIDGFPSSQSGLRRAAASAARHPSASDE
ncbi:NADPH-dependent F420 reductase [Micromonospora sp. DT81.3]|uniref:NADPH-dependent F420 reductase n=1 Tax=Actinomycetes TaxID=1760 RepID=UPI003CF981C3